MYERKFTLIHMIYDFPELKEECSPEEEHFGVLWKLVMRRDENSLAIFLHCEKENDERRPWSISVDFKISLFTMADKGLPAKKLSHKYEKKEGCGWPEFHSWEDIIKNHMVHSMVIVNCEVVVNSIQSLPKRKIYFDKPQQNLTDVILNVDDKKFYVSRVYLATHSSFFNTLFFGKFSEAHKAEVPLKDVDGDDFHSLLEIIHGKSTLTAENVAAVLQLADMFDVPIAREKCEEFLIQCQHTEKKTKLLLADIYNLIYLKRHCLESINCLAELKAFMPENIDDLSRSTRSALLKKCIYQF